MKNLNKSGAQRYCEARGLEFSQQFARQYALSKDKDLSFPTWTKVTFGDWILHHCPELPVAKIHDSAGTLVGFLLGIGITGDGDFIDDVLKLPGEFGTATFDSLAEQEIEAIAGRYVALLLRGDTPRIYFDPVCDYATVYDPKTETIASSLFLCLRREPINNPEIDYHDVVNDRRIFTFGHTRDKFVKRPLSNHYLDLKSFALVRHWPKPETRFKIAPGTEKQAIAKIAARLGLIFERLVNNTSCIMPISGGRDSRNILACGRAHLDKLKFGFTWQFHKQSRIDAEIAADVAKFLGIEHRIFPFAKSTREKRLKYYLRTGYATGGGGKPVAGIIEQIPGGHVIILGNIMELLRANQWQRHHIHRKIVPRHGLKRIGITGNNCSPEEREKWLVIYNKWLATVPPGSRRSAYDLGFLELLLPNTLGARHFLIPQNFYLNPFNDRSMISLAMSLPVEYRLDDMPNKELLAQTYSDLGQIRFT